MSSTNQRSQKAGAKAAKRRQAVAAKKKLEQGASGLAGRIALAAASPFERCIRSEELFDAGIGYVIVAKRLPSHLLSCAFFLVDVFCLGVKDLYHVEMTPLELEERLEDLRDVGRFIDMAPACARALIRRSVAFAAEAKLSPTKDYATVEKIFGDVDTGQCTEDFVLGKDGKPFFIASPNDTPAKIREVVTKLEARYQPGQWDYTIPLIDDDDDDFLSESLDDEDWLEGGPVIDHDPNEG